MCVFWECGGMVKQGWWLSVGLNVTSFYQNTKAVLYRDPLVRILESGFKLFVFLLSWVKSSCLSSNLLCNNVSHINYYLCWICMHVSIIQIIIIMLQLLLLLLLLLILPSISIKNMEDGMYIIFIDHFVHLLYSFLMISRSISRREATVAVWRELIPTLGL